MKWDDVYRDRIEGIEKGDFDSKNGLKSTAKAINKTSFKNAKIPFIIGLIVSLFLTWLMNSYGMIDGHPFALGKSGFLAVVIIFGLIFLIVFGITGAIIQLVYYLTQKKPQVQEYGEYKLDDEKSGKE